jgi:hypothetical protein
MADGFVGPNLQSVLDGASGIAGQVIRDAILYGRNFAGQLLLGGAPIGPQERRDRMTQFILRVFGTAIPVTIVNTIVDYVIQSMKEQPTLTEPSVTKEPESEPDRDSKTEEQPDNITRPRRDPAKPVIQRPTLERTGVTEESITTIPLVIDIQPDPEIITDETNKKLEFSVEDEEPVFLVKNNNKQDDIKITRDALFSYRRDVLGTAKTNPFIASQEKNDLIKYSDIQLQPPRLFTRIDDTQYFKSDRHEQEAAWIRSAGDMLSVPSEVPFLSNSIPLVKPSFDEFKDRQGNFQFMPNGSRNDLVAFNNPFRSFTDVNSLNPDRTRLFGATF